MKLKELKSFLRSNPNALSRFVLPDGDVIPADFHITEVGHITKRFIDCGGKVHDQIETCLLQTWTSDADPDHRLSAATFLKILDLGAKILPHDDLDVEVEYEECAVTQFPILSAVVSGEHIDIQLGEKHTDCLAKERCGIKSQSCAGDNDARQTESVTCC